VSDMELEQKLFESAMKQIRKHWKKRTVVKQFVAVTQSELRYIRYYYMMQMAQKTAIVIENQLKEAAEHLQLVITTKLERMRFGIQVSVAHGGVHYGEIYIGPRDAWDKIMYLPPTGTRWYDQHQENPYTKKRLKQWKIVSDFDFDAFMAVVKEAIDHPLPPEEDGDDEIPF